MPSTSSGRRNGFPPFLPVLVFAALSLAAVSALPAVAQPATMVADIRTVGDDLAAWLFPSPITELGGALYFFADDKLHGRELWSSDGTAAGTTMVADIDPVGSSAPASFASWNGAVWFGADDGVHGRELWTSDGTVGGTALVKDLDPGPNSGYLTDQAPLTHLFTPTALGGVLLFPADDGTHGQELWTTDGTAGGTSMLTDIEPGTEGSSPLFLTALDGFVYFQAARTGSGREVWSTDGTATGTALFADIEPGPGWSSPGAFFRAAGRLFFPATTSVAGRELWATDGAVTEMVADVNPGAPDGLPLVTSYGIAPFGDVVLFQADYGVHGFEPWISDGTDAGTAMLGDIDPGSAGAFEVLSQPLVARSLDDRAYFFARDTAAPGPVLGWELWGTDGTPEGTSLVRDIDQQASSVTTEPGWSYTEMVDVAGQTFFYADDGVHGLELWVSDGTATGTHLVSDLAPGADGIGAQFLTRLNDLLFFSGRGSGTERWLYRSDGEAAGTVPVVAGPPLDPRVLTPFGGALYFIAADGAGQRSLWRSDGSEAGTASFPAGDPVADVRELAAGPDRLDVATSSALWTTAGDAASTEVLASVEAYHLRRSVNLTFFVAEVTDGLGELWETDGTASGTHRVLDVRSGSPGAIPVEPSSNLPRPDHSPIAVLGYRDAAFFAADDGVHGAELWWSDGTPQGTVLDQDIDPGAASSSPAHFTLSAGKLFFTATDGVHGFEPWAMALEHHWPR